MNFQLARLNMVEQQVRPWHVLDQTVLTTLSEIPREIFVPPAYLNLAYSDTDIPLEAYQTMLAPKVVGRILQALTLTGQEKVLEVGTGTGYLTACLSKLVNLVVSVEINANLFSQAQKRLADLNCRNLILEAGDAALGWEDESPFDVIIVTGSYPLGVPAKVCSQLKVKGGRLFAICGQGQSMKAILIERLSEINYHTTSLFETFIPALVNAPQPQKFQF